MVDVLQDAKNLMETEQEYAIYLLSEAIEKNFDKAEALCLRATCYMQLNRYKEASVDLENALLIDRELAIAHKKLSKCKLALGELIESINAMTNLKHLEPDNGFAKVELEKLESLQSDDKRAKKFFEEKKYEDVIKIMDACLQKADICIRFKLMKAECLVHLEKYEEALQMVNDILFTHKDDTEAIYLRAIILLYQEKYALGITVLKEIIAISPKATNMFKKYKLLIEKLKNAKKEFENNNLDKARPLYEQALKLDPKNKLQNKQILINLANIHLKQKSYEDAIIQSSLALEIETHNLKALKIRAECNFELKDFDVAVEDYKEIVQLENNSANKKKFEQAQKKLNENDDKYQLLGVAPNASENDIKKAYHKLALLNHPDKHANKIKYLQHKTQVRFKRIQNAYQKLTENQ